jgi:hypothetical protein
MILLTTLEDTFLPSGVPEMRDPPDAQMLDRWRRRYFAGLRRLRQAGIQTVADEQAGAEVYVSLRACWDRYITTLAPSMAYSIDEIDPVGSDPESADERQEFRRDAPSVATLRFRRGSESLATFAPASMWRGAGQ